MKTIDTLIEDIYALFGSEEKYEDKLFEDFGKNVHSLMDKRFHQKYDGSPYLRMSNIGKRDRQLWYDINDPEGKEEFQPHTLVKFAYGDLIEQMIILYAKMAGHDVQMEQAEVEVDGVKGHIDCTIDGVVVDVKSASPYSFQKFKAGDLGEDTFGYIKQLAGYVEAVTPGKEGAFLAIDKTNGHLCLYRVPVELLAGVRDRIEHIRGVVEDKENIPPRCFPDIPDGKSGNMKLDVGCSYCAHKFKCWPGLKAYYYSSGPRYLTKVMREPKVGGDFE